jgi:hypothetical protein
MNRYSNSPKGVMMAVLGMSAGGDWYLVVPLVEVDLSEDGEAVQAVGQVLHVWEGVPVRGGDGVEVTGVFAGPPGAVLFGYHVQW